MATAETEQGVKTISSIERLIKKFAERVTYHGVGRTVIRGQVRRIIWIIIVLCNTGWALYQLATLFQAVAKYPETSTVSRKHDSSLTFPAVTVCNMNTLRRSQLPEETLQFIAQQVQECGSSRSLEDYVLREIDVDVRKKAWHNISDMLIRCTFNQKKCSSENFIRVAGIMTGSCYTFNREGNLQRRYMTKAGPQYGLELQLNVELHEYISLSRVVGFSVIVHEPDEPSFLEDGGILVGPGHVTSIAMKKTRIQRLQSPHGNCVKHSHNSDRNLYAALNYSYTQSGCMKSCYQHWLHDMCNCCDIDLPCDQTVILRTRRNHFNKTSPIIYCNVKDTGDDYECFHKVLEQFNKDDTKCIKLCPPVCDETEYETVVSSASLPSAAKLVLRVKQSNVQNGTDSEIVDSQKNVLTVEVFYQSLEVTEIVKEAAYGWNTIFSAVGGHLSLWLGISMLTIVEVLELVIDIAVTCIRGVHRKFMSKEIKTSL